MSFDPSSFLHATTTESNDTQLVPVPEGEYIAIAEKVDMRQWKKKDDPSATGLALDITWNIDDAGVKAALGREKVTVRQGIMLDVTDDGTGLDMGKGKNVGLGKLREALDLNQPGRPFAPSMIEGRMCKVQVKHRLDPQDAEKIYSEVKANARV
ncbi:hypothetical protein [Bacteriophage sp.]|nr:hypothetical protein [Bacteriophage sp.]